MIEEKWTQKNKKWSDEIVEWVKSICPAREHGFNSRQEIIDEINRRFGRQFNMRAFCTHVYECDIHLGFARSQVPSGEKHWRHRKVGEIQTKKGYKRIKVAEPNKWMQYQRWIWEQHHPGESAEGKRVIFMDGNRENFAPENLECITKAEQTMMNNLGCKVSSTRAEREVYLLRARLLLKKSEIMGGARESQRQHQKLYYERNKDTPEFKQQAHERYLRRKEEIKSDPVRYQQILEKQREYREKNRERVNKWHRERMRKMKREEPKRYREILDKNNERARLRKSKRK